MFHVAALRYENLPQSFRFQISEQDASRILASYALVPLPKEGNGVLVTYQERTYWLVRHKAKYWMQNQD